MGDQIPIPLRVHSIPRDDGQTAILGIAIHRLDAGIPLESTRAADVFEQNDPTPEEEPEPRAIEIHRHAKQPSNERVRWFGSLESNSHASPSVSWSCGLGRGRDLLWCAPRFR